MAQSNNLNQIDKTIGGGSLAEGLVENIARGLGVSSILAIKPMAKYLSGARCTLKINDKLAAFAFGVSWNIETSVTEIRTIDNYLPHELAPKHVRVTGTLSGFRIPGESSTNQNIQADVLGFLVNKYITIEVRDSQSDNRIFQTNNALVTSRSEVIRTGELATQELTWEAIGWIDEKSPKPPDFSGGTAGSFSGLNLF